MEDDPWSGPPNDDHTEGTRDIPVKAQPSFTDIEKAYDDGFTEIDDSSQTTRSLSEDQYNSHQLATASPGTTGTSVLSNIDSLVTSLCRSN